MKERSGQPPADEKEIVSAEELHRRLNETQAELQADIDAYDEQAAIRAEALDDGKSTDQRAIEALKRPERFKGEHDVARAWLKNSPTARIFERTR